MEGTLFPCNVRKVSTLVDGSLTITLETPEMTNEEAAKLLSLRRSTGMAYLSPKTIETPVMDTIDAMTPEITGGKSLSKRQRDHLYIIWSMNNHGYEDFELFYNFRMNQNLAALKEEIKQYEQ